MEIKRKQMSEEERTRLIELSEKIINKEDAYYFADFERNQEQETIQMAIVKANTSGEELFVYDTLIKSEHKLDERLVGLTKITNEELEQAKEPKEVMEDFFEKIMEEERKEKYEIFVWGDDQIFFEYFLEKNDMNHQKEKIELVNLQPYVSRKAFKSIPKQISMRDVYELLRIEYNQSHQALEDVRDMIKVFQKVLEGPKEEYFVKLSEPYHFEDRTAEVATEKEGLQKNVERMWEEESILLKNKHQWGKVAETFDSIYEEIEKEEHLNLEYVRLFLEETRELKLKLDSRKNLNIMSYLDSKAIFELYFEYMKYDIRKLKYIENARKKETYKRIINSTKNPSSEEMKKARYKFYKKDKNEVRDR